MSLYRIGAAFTFALAISFAPAAHVRAADVQVYPLEASGYMPDSVARAADGSIWFSAAQYIPCHGEVTCQNEELGTIRSKRVHERGLGRTTLAGGTYGVVAGPAQTLWVTDSLKAASVFDLSGKQIASVKVRDENGSGALSAPFVGPDGRMWFAQGSFGEGARGIVAVDPSYHLVLVAGCARCFISGGTVGADGDAWFLDPYLGGFYRVSPQGNLVRFDFEKEVLQTIVAGPRAGLWGMKNNQIADYDLEGKLRQAFSPKIFVQSGLQVIGADLFWANFGASKGGGNELRVVKMTASGETTVSRFHNLGACTAGAQQFFSSGPTLGGDGALYVGIGCSPHQPPYTVGGHADIVRIGP